MKPILLAALCGALLVICTRAPEPEESSELAPDERASARAEIYQPRASAARAGPPRSAMPADTPRLPGEGVAFDRRPWDPKAELRETYEARAEVVAAWDRFRAESGISDQRARKILLLLFDYSENSKYIRADLYRGAPYDREKWVFERRLAEVSAMRHTLYIQTCETIEKMLSREEYRVWRRTVEQAQIWAALITLDLFTEGHSFVDLMFE